MKYLFFNAAGFAVSSVEAAAGAFNNEGIYDTLICRISSLDIDKCFLSLSGDVKLLPSKPSYLHTWDRTAETWISPTLFQIAEIYSPKINEVTQNKIFSKYPQTKQANLQARWSELVYEDMLLGAGVLTNQNSAEGIAIRAVWNWIKDIRLRSNVATNAITLLSDENTIVADAELILNNFKLEIESL